jgi:hypothetical protein
MRAHRERRRSGLRCFTLEIRAQEIDVLVQRGLLSPDARNQPYAVIMALYRHLENRVNWRLRTAEKQQCARDQ